MILTITGNGKGKTTSALGMALRSAGWNKKTAIVFFDKGGSHYGEQNILDFLQQKIDIFRFGLKRFDEKKKTFRFKNTIADKKEAEKALYKVKTLLKKKYFLIVCDELINCLNLKLVAKNDVEALIKACPKTTHLAFTGRNAPAWLAKKADLVSEIKEAKHYFKKAGGAVKG
ncbi:cob(I)yrinic acid a,c-diamide adenosyltransferase, partial [Candidatus Peregrinibacteria bacterium]|nr:cob(I)yrinic acid a,c-diamide adenosyltransferase [Candidatus Peregrinibacteria bacterium]